MNQQTLEKALSALPLGPILFYDRIGSTNEEAIHWADDGAPNLSLVVADEQTAGQGRYNRRWFTPPGAALAFSLILKNFNIEIQHDDPTVAQKLARLTALGAVAICLALKKEYDLEPEIKWPNDVLIGGHKLSGILVNGLWAGDKLAAVILGIGINVAPQSVPIDTNLDMPATCVETALGKPISRLNLLQVVLEGILHWQSQLDSPTFLNIWNELLAYRGEWVQLVSYTDNSTEPPQEGQLLGISFEGWLQLRSRDGMDFYLKSGEISLRPTPE